MCMHVYISKCILIDNDLVASGSNESDRSVWESFGSDVASNTPTSVSIHSPTPQISLSLEQEEGMIEEETDYSMSKSV